jgi:hypothetical protein
MYSEGEKLEKKWSQNKKVPKSQNGGSHKSMANWDFLLGCHQEKFILRKSVL